MLSWIGRALLTLVVSLLTAPLVFGDTFLEARTDSQGWTAIHPGPLSLLFSLLCACLAALGALMGCLALASVLGWTEPLENVWVHALVGPPLTLLMLFSIWLVAITQLSVSNEGVAYRAFRRWRRFAWSEIESVDALLGSPRLRVREGDGRRYFFSPVGVGRDEVLDAFRERGIAVAIAG